MPEGIPPEVVRWGGDEAVDTLLFEGGVGGAVSGDVGLRLAPLSGSNCTRR